MLIQLFHCCHAAGNALTGPPAGSDTAGAQHRDPKTEAGEFRRCGSRGGRSAVTSNRRELLLWGILRGRAGGKMLLLEPIEDKEMATENSKVQTEKIECICL